MSEFVGKIPDDVVSSVSEIQSYATAVNTRQRKIGAINYLYYVLIRLLHARRLNPLVEVNTVQHERPVNMN